MHILQVSAPKSGSYWLNTLISKILDHKAIPIKSFIQNQPEYEVLKDLKLSFREQSSVDMIDIEEDGIFFRVSSVLKKRIPNIREYVSSSSLTWTHSTWCTKSPEVFTLYDKKVCIIRDPRDRALSASRFAFTPYMQEFYPSRHASQKEFLAEEYERLLDQWFWFYGNYLLHKEEVDIHFVFYEQLLENFEEELDRLLMYLGVELDPNQKQDIATSVAFSNMKEKSPRHLEKGRSRKWVEQLSKDQQELAKKRTGYLLQLLNYPLNPEEDTIPFYPKSFDREILQEKLSRIDWSKLY